MPNLKETLRPLRIKKGLTQKKLGELCSINEVQIRNYELGKLNPKLETIKKIAAALEVPYTDLLDSDSDEFHTFKDKRKAFAAQWNASQNEKRMTELFNQLNEAGQDKAIENTELLTKVPDYKKGD